MTIPEGAPRYYTVEEVAAILRLPATRHIDRNAANWPHIEIARQRLFTVEDIDAIAAMHRKGDSPERPTFSSQVTRGQR
jgi:hypothetical protein